MDAFSDPTVVAEQEMVEQDKSMDLVVQRVREQVYVPFSFITVVCDHLAL